MTGRDAHASSNPQPDRAEITVKGQGEAWGVPDLITYTVSLFAHGASEEEAHVAFQTRKDKLHSRLERLGVKETHYRALRDHLGKDREPRVWADRPPPRWRRGAGWSAHYVLGFEFGPKDEDIAVRVRDEFFDSQPGTDDGVSGGHQLSYAFTPSNPTFGEVCRLAAIDGRRKAEAIAAEMGASLGQPISVREPERIPRLAPPVPVVIGKPPPLVDSPGGAAELVRAEVEMTFEITPLPRGDWASQSVG